MKFFFSEILHHFVDEISFLHFITDNSFPTLRGKANEGDPVVIRVFAPGYHTVRFELFEVARNGGTVNIDELLQGGLVDFIRLIKLAQELKT